MPNAQSESWTASARSKTRFLLAVLVSGALLLSGCASSGGGAGESSAGPSVLTGGRSVGHLSVSNGGELPADATGVADRFSIARDLEAGIRRSVTGGAISDSGSLSVVVEIVKVRVRSTASAILWGVMAGSDVIDVRVSISDNGQMIKNFDTGISTSLGGFIYGAQGKRITRMINGLSKRIAAGI